MVSFWNDVDRQIETDVDVVDDHLGDAKEVHAVNSWLTYGEPIQRFREFGSSFKELDFLDESTLGKEQLRVICAFL